MIMTILRIIPTVMTRLMITVQIPARILPTRTIPNVDSSTDNNYDDGSGDNVVDEGISQPGDYDYPDSTDDGGDGFTYYEPDNTGTDDTTSSDNGDYAEE